MKYLLSLMVICLAFYYFKRISRYNGRVVKLIYFELIYNLIIKYLIGNVGLPSMLNYVTDLVLVWILLEYFHQKKSRGLRIPKSLVVRVTFLWVVSIISYVFNIYSPALYLWGFRNNFRFLLFAMMCAVYLKKEDIHTIIDILFGFFVLNILVVTYQAFFTSYSFGAVGDFISGLFSNGTERGGNASLDWLMCILCVYSIILYLNKVGTLQRMLICLVGSFYMAAMAEIKLFYVQIVIIGIVALIICKKSLKVVGFTVIGVVALIVGIRLLYYAFPHFANFFTYDAMLKYVTRGGGYSSRGYTSGIDRFTAIPYIFEHFSLTIGSRLFGRGLGNADYSSFSFLTSSFYKNYGWSGYTFFYSSMITVEMGIVGLITYILNIINYVRTAMLVKTNTMYEKSVTQATIIIGIICVLSIFSNQTMKLEASAYMVHCLMIFPLLIRNNDDSEVGESLTGKLPFRWGRNHGL